MIKIKKIIFLLILLLSLISYKCYTVYQDKIISEEKKILKDVYDEALKSHINDLKTIKHNNILDGSQKANIEEFKEPIPIKNITVEKRDTKKEKVKRKYKILGKIEIKKINFTGVIIDKATEENLKIGICKVEGNDINQIGNLVLAGHNMKDGSLFGNLKLLEIGDTFKLFDSRGNYKTYKIYRKKIISPYNLSILTQDTNEVRATLFTCTNQGEERLVLYGISNNN